MEETIRQIVLYQLLNLFGFEEAILYITAKLSIISNKSGKEQIAYKR